MVPQLRLASTYGEVRKRRQIGGFLLSETAYRADLKIPRHSHELAYFYTVLEGAYTETLASKTLDRKPFTLAFRPAGGVGNQECLGADHCGEW